MYAFMLAAILLTVLGNLLVIISISHFKHLQSPTNLIILSLALVDCLLGCLIMPFSMVRSVEGCWFLGDVICKVHSGLDMTLSLVSIMHLCLVSVERYLAICEPLTYKMTVTNSSVAVCISITWLIPFTYSFGIVFSQVNTVGLDMLMLNPCVGNCALVFNKQWAVLASFTNFFIPGSIMSSLYLKIFFVANKQARVISDMMAAITSSEVKSHSSEQRERKAAKTLAVVMGVFLLCWLPFFIATITDPFIDFSTPVVVFDALVWFGYFNSTFNPLIYGFFYPRFQRAFKIIVSKYVCHLCNFSNSIF
ncbi:trace amine-associated receptor 4-like [Colossoma macropomum]|uniref:trace amine-associated receptor 4-like n=1 Tax=Colossoma macropomum TaxID=42526 RepID=UPI001864911D|nr:trace amine-associated receptor 4-like [Colossoma macropomum]